MNSEKQSKVEQLIEKTLLPLATWVAQNTYIQILSQTFISLLPMIVIGAFAFIVSKSPINYTGFEEGTYWYNFFLNWDTFANKYLIPIRFMKSCTLGSLSLWVTFGIAYRWAKKYDLEVQSTIIVALVNFFLINSKYVDGGISTDYFGGEGLFSAMIGAFLILILYRWMSKKGIGNIKFPASVPATLQKAMSSILPLTLCFLVGCLASGLTTQLLGVSIPDLVMMIGRPITKSIDNPIAQSGITFFSDIGYWFGIHTAAVEAPFNPILYANLSANVDAYSNGVAATQLPYIINIAFRYGFTGIGGSGATFGLVLLLLKSKSVTMKQVGKLSIIPALFGVNEPVVFGLPIMCNGTMFIPFIFTEVINCFISYFAMSAGLVNRCMFYMGGTAPEIMRSVLSSMDWRAAVLWVILVIVDMLFWYPFFKMYEKQEIKREAEELESQKVAA